MIDYKRTTVLVLARECGADGRVAVEVRDGRSTSMERWKPERILHASREGANIIEPTVATVHSVDEWRDYLVGTFGTKEATQ